MNGYYSDTIYVQEDIYNGDNLYTFFVAGIKKVFLVEVLNGATEVFFNFPRVNQSGFPINISTTARGGTDGNSVCYGVNIYSYNYEEKNFNIMVENGKPFLVTDIEENEEPYLLWNWNMLNPSNIIGTRKGLNVHYTFGDGRNNIVQNHSILQQNAYRNYFITNIKDTGEIYFALGDFYNSTYDNDRSVTTDSYRTRKYTTFHISIDTTSDYVGQSRHYEADISPTVNNQDETLYYSIGFNIKNIITDTNFYNNGQEYKFNVNIIGTQDVTNKAKGVKLFFTERHMMFQSYDFYYQNGSLTRYNFFKDGSGSDINGNGIQQGGGGTTEEGEKHWYTPILDFVSGIFKSIMEVLGNIVQSLLDGLIGLFVPEDSFWEDTYNDLYLNLNTKFPIQDYIDTLNNASDAHSGNIDIAIDLNNYKLSNINISLSKFIDFGIFYKYRDTWYSFISAVMTVTLFLYNLKNTFNILNDASNIIHSTSREDLQVLQKQEYSGSFSAGYGSASKHMKRPKHML